MEQEQKSEEKRGFEEKPREHAENGYVAMSFLY